MAITNNEAVRFVNEQVRPLCEKTRALIAEIDALKTVWFAGLNLDFPNDETNLADGRAGEGVSRLSGADINSAVGILIAIAAASNAEIISKPCVRALSAQ